MRIFVSPHAVRAYQQRVHSRLTEAQAEQEIVAALQKPLFRCSTSRGDATLWGCRNRVGFPILVATDPADEGAEFLLVRTVGPWWFWHEAKKLWRQYR